ADQLNGKRCEQHIAPDRLVLRKLWNEPAEAELARLVLETPHLLGLRRFVRDEDRRRVKQLLEVARAARLRNVAAGLYIEEALAVLLEDQRRSRSALEKCDERQRRFTQLRRAERELARLEAERARRLDQAVPRIRRRKLLKQKRRVERHSMD